MHYAATSVSRNGKPVMVPRDIKYLHTLGSRMLTFNDILMINMHYGCLKKCQGQSPAACENGGFPHPRDCSKCICPTGYGGRLCNERPSGCGKILTATSSFQTLEDTLGDPRSNIKLDEYKMCNYWIQAPVGSTIEVVLDKFKRGLEYGDCVHAGIEIKTGKDTRVTGYRFCDSRFDGVSLISTQNIVPIITFNRFHESKAVLRYRIASSGPTTSQAPYSPTVDTTSSPTYTSSPGCKDISDSVCRKLMSWNFCHSSKYDEDIRKLICPQSCKLC